MPLHHLEALLTAELYKLEAIGARKGNEAVITAMLPPQAGRGPRYLIAGEGERPFLRMNSNGYLGMALRPEVIAAEEHAVRDYGAGPAAVRFISGTFAPHVTLEHRLAEFHQRAAGMIFSSAYAAVMSILPVLVTPETAVISDALNHNCIINAIRLAQPKFKHIYRHLDLADLENGLRSASGQCQRAIVVTDGIFSMRGDHAPIPAILNLARQYDSQFPENVVVVVDDSHGVGALGATGRGTEEFTGSEPVDVLIATLGKAFGVNGGYVVGSQPLIDYLRERANLYIYSNSITPGEAAAACKAVEILMSPAGTFLLQHLRELTHYFREALVALGFETLPGDHPVVPLLVRDTARTKLLVKHLRDHGILATGLRYPVVPQGEEEIRFQISAEHTRQDLDRVLAVLRAAPVGRTHGFVPA